MAGSLRSPLAPWIGGASAPVAGASAGLKSPLAPWMGGASGGIQTGGFRSLLAPWMGGASATDTTGCYFNGEFYGAGFFCGGTPPTPTPAPTVTPAGRHKKRRKQKLMIGDRLYEVENLRDVEFILKRLVRAEAGTVTEGAKARVRVVDRVSTRVEENAPVALQMASAEVDWSSLWAQLAIQDRAYAMVLEKVLARQEEDDIEAILMALH